MPTRRLTPGLLILLLALAALAAPDRSGTAREPGDPVYFSMSIADESGEVLAQPKLVGRGGVPLSMTLADPGNADEPRMSLSMQPERVRDGSYEICFEISVPGRVQNGKGKLKLRSGEEKKTRVTYPGGHLDVQLAAFDVRSPEFQLYLQYGGVGAPRARPST